MAKRYIADKFEGGEFIGFNADTITIATIATPVNEAFTAGAGTLGGATYYYRVTATNANGETLPSTETSLKVGISTPVNAAFTNGAGTLADATYFYRVSAINATGETLASAETSLAIARLATPVNAAFTAGTGTLVAATYYYRVSAINAIGETLASAETSFAAAADTGVNVNWGAITGATGYKIYGRSTGAELLMATVGDVLTWLDDGSITPAGALPASNTTAGGINVNWGEITGATGYKVYGRSTGAELLIASVGLVLTYLDNGSVTPVGALPAANTTASTGINVNWGAVTGATGYKIYGRSTGAELLIATVGAVLTYLDNGSITPSGAMPTVNSTFTPPTNATLTDAGYSQAGKVIRIDNGANVINYTVNAGITASFVKGGMGAITFVQGAGRTLTGENGTLVFDGAVNSSASIVSFGTTDILYINNL